MNLEDGEKNNKFRHSHYRMFNTLKRPSYLNNVKSTLPDWVTKEWVIYKALPNFTLALLAVGAGAASGLLFYQPSEAYTKTEDFGIWFSETVTDQARWIFFVSGAWYIGPINLYYTRVFSRKYPAFLKQQTNTLKKVLASFGLLGFSFIQLINPYAAIRSSDENGDLGLIFLTCLGFFPMTICVGINGIKEDLPKIFYYLNSFRIWLWKNTIERFSMFEPSEAVAAYRMHREELEKIYSFINYKAQDGLSNFLQNMQSTDRFPRPTADSKPHESLSFLLSKSSAQNYEKPWAAIWIYLGWACLTLALLFPFLYADVRNIIFQLDRLIGIVLAVGLGFMASTAIIYFTTNFIGGFFIGAHEYFKNRSRPINWPHYHISPTAAIITTVVNIIILLLSYTVAVGIFKKNYDLSEKDTVGYLVAWWTMIATIVLYHIMGKIKVDGLIMRDIAATYGNERQQLLVKLFDVISEYRTPYQLALEIEKIDLSEREIALGDKSQDFIDTLNRYREASQLIRTAPCCSWRREADEESQSLIAKTASNNFNLYDSMGNSA